MSLSGKIRCPQCKRFFLPKHRAQKFCSKEYRDRSRQISKGLDKNIVQWKAIREFILERDNFTCQDCGQFSLNGGIEVHHIKPLYESGSNLEDNLITLCHPCHKRRHSLA